jgi:DNA-binding transcriptional ArsR family regulator
MTPQKDNIIQVKRLSADTEYFNNVFKRTEKVVSVVFYILANLEDKKDSQVHIEILKDRALKTHEAALQTLPLQAQAVAEGVRKFQYTLVALESTLRVAEAAAVVPAHINQMLFEQLVTIERYISNHYLHSEGIDLGEQATMLETKNRKPAPTVKRPEQLPRRRSVQIPAGDISSDAYMVYSQLTDRAERIKTVLEAKPHATIKDITEIITDVSEKTIQRELNSLIEKGQVQREGERRWSRYSVAK